MFSHGCTQSWGVPVITFRIFKDHITILSLRHMQHLRWSSLWRKISICWKLLLTVATASFILNVTGLLDLILKHIDKFRLRQINIPCGIYMFKIVKKHQNNVSNIFVKKVTKTRPRASIINFEHISHFIPLLLLLNSNK